jgi:hypothetical protein
MGKLTLTETFHRTLLAAMEYLHTEVRISHQDFLVRCNWCILRCDIAMWSHFAIQLYNLAPNYLY